MMIKIKIKKINQNRILKKELKNMKQNNNKKMMNNSKY